MAICKVTILDEVNCKISGLDLDTRKALVKEFKYEDPSARYSPSYKLGRWDGTVSFFGLGGTTYLSMLPRVLEILDKKNYDIELEDLRHPVDLKFDKISEDFWGDKVWPKGHVMEGQPIRLRDYQVEAVNNFLVNPQSIQCIATAAGKTIVTATLAYICEKFGRTITIVPNKSLVEQTEEYFVTCGLDVGVYYGDRKELNRTHIICTWQSLNILDKKSDDVIDALTLAEFLEGVQTIIIDECHQAKASVLKKLLTHNLSNAPVRWGLTGTIPKQDFEFESLRASLGEVINQINAHDLQERGILSNCHVNIIQTVEWKEFRDYAQESTFLTTDSTRMTYISELIQKIAETGNTLVLVNRIDSGEFLAEKIPDSVFVSGKIKTKDRKKEYDEVKIVDNKIIIATYGVASTGIDIQRIFNLILLEPGKSFVRVIQSIGRGLRKAKDKDHVEIYDLTATTKYAKRHLTERKRYYKESQYPFSIEKITYQ